MAIYADFHDVIVLNTAHRIQTVKDPTNEQECAYNARAQRFLEILHRLRDLEWTMEDYFWLCKRKKAQLSLRERAFFHDAPVIMEFRRATDDNPEMNCEFFNKMKIRALARETHTAVARFDAQHTGIAHTEGMDMPDNVFRGLSKELEVAEGARIILTHNLAVEQGLMNGTQGTIKEIVFRPGDHPNHEDSGRRMPEAIIADFPKYGGPAFFDTTM